MNLDKVFTSKWLRAADIEEMAGDSDTAIVTIDHVAMEEVGQDGQTKPIVYFRGVDAGLVLNKTNAVTLGQLLGKETDTWTGKMVGLFTTEVDFQGKQVLSIRVRLKAPKITKPAPAVVPDTEDIPF